MKNITSKQLADWIHSSESFQLIDVREPREHNAFNIGGLLIPLAEITRQSHLVETGKPVVFYCRVGVRSQIAIQRLQEKYPFQNLFNLSGGIEAWKKEFTS